MLVAEQFLIFVPSCAYVLSKDSSCQETPPTVRHLPIAALPRIGRIEVQPPFKVTTWLPRKVFSQRFDPAHNVGPSLIESIQDTVSSGLGSLANSLGIKDDNNPSPGHFRQRCPFWLTLANLSSVSSRYQSPAGMNSMNYHTHNHSSVDPTTAFQVSELQSNQPAGGWGDGSSNNSSPNRSTTYEQAAVTTLCLTRGNAIAPTRQVSAFVFLCRRLIHTRNLDNL